MSLAVVIDGRENEVDNEATEENMMRHIIEVWADSVGWKVGPHGHRYSVKQNDQLRLICNDAPTRGYTNIFIKGRSPAELTAVLGGLRMQLVREDARYDGTTLHVPPYSLDQLLMAVGRHFGS